MKHIANVLSAIAIMISIFSLVLSSAPRLNLIGNDVYKKAEDGDFDSQMYLGQNYFEIGNYEDSYYWFSRASLQNEEADVDVAFAALGYILGSGMLMDDVNYITNREKTKKCFDKALEFADEENKKQIIINYLSFLLSSSLPDVEYDEKGQVVSKNDDKFIMDNIELIQNLLNGLYDIAPDDLSKIGYISFPIIDKEHLYAYIVDKKISVGHWEYDYTKVSENGNLAFSSKNEQLILVDMWAEDVSDVCFSTVLKYKYYHYKMVVDREKNVQDMSDILKEKFIEIPTD